MSALPSKTDIRQCIEHVCFVPLPDLAAAAFWTERGCLKISGRLCDHCEVSVAAIQVLKFQYGTGITCQFGEFGLEFRPRMHGELTQPSEQRCLEPPGPSLLLTEVQNVQPAAWTGSFERPRQHLSPCGDHRQ